MRTNKIISTLAAATLLLSGAAIADGKKLTDKLSNGALAINIQVPSCNADSAILCPGLPLSSKKSLMCLMAYEDNLSTVCKVGLVEAAMAVETGMLALNYSIQACEADADKHCLDVEPGEGKIVSCLKKHEKKISNECSTALKETGLWNIGSK